MRELTKSIVRRMHEPAFMRYFAGKGIDIGGAPDPLLQYEHLFPLMEQCQIWDRQHGDAQYMPTVADEKFDFVHSSHTLEHMEDPATAMVNWIRILKRGGYLVCIVPHEMLYEHGQWPSQYNNDHKWSFRVGGVSLMPKSINLLTFLNGQVGVDVISIRLLHETFDYSAPGDQTLGPIAECAIEFVLLKR